MMKKFISLKKIGGRRWLFSKQQHKEQHNIIISQWILAASSWADNGFWVDSEVWND
jgi:hypothetical protein